MCRASRGSFRHCSPLVFGRERNFSFPAFDQVWLNAFFSEKMPTGRALLDVHWNWKVYWGGSLWKLHCGEGKGEPERDSTCQPRLKHSPYIVHFHGPKPGRGTFLECLASMNNACLAKLSREHPYWTLCNNGFRADGCFLANSSLRLYQRFSADCHEWCGEGVEGRREGIEPRDRRDPSVRDR